MTVVIPPKGGNDPVLRSSAYDQIIALLPQLNAQERGALRWRLSQPGGHETGDPAKVGTNVIQTAKG